MCTAISDNSGRHLFGRTLDLEYSLSEQAVITPRRFEFKFLREPPLTRHLAIIGIAHVFDGIPLYYDATNEAGLAAAGLNFGGSAVYSDPSASTHNIAAFELIPWVLGQCKSVGEAAELLKGTSITADSVDASLPATPLHWLIADRTGAIAAEPIANGLKICEDPFGVLTNEPSLDYHLTNVKNYMSLDASPPQNTLCPNVKLEPYSRGMGAIGLPGDLSSSSRFVRAIFAKSHTLPESEQNAAINRFFRIMDTVSVPRGCIITDEGKAVSTVYVSCADTECATYYFSTYGDRSIRSLRISEVNLDSNEIFAETI